MVVLKHLITGELKRIWREAVVAYSRFCPGICVEGVVIHCYYVVAKGLNIHSMLMCTCTHVGTCFSKWI